MNEITNSVSTFCILFGIGMVVFAGVLWFAVNNKDRERNNEE